MTSATPSRKRRFAVTWSVVFERFLPCVLAVAFAWGGFADEAFDCPALIARARRHPSLLFTADGREAARVRIAENQVARAWWADFRSAVDRRLANRPDLPSRGAQWFHWYCCKACGVHLKTETPTRHVCSKCGAVYSGWPYDDAAFFSVHHALGLLVRDCGIVWSLSDDRRYADAARSVLMDYAGTYRSYPRHDNSGPTERNRDAGRAFSQILDESVWLINLVQGYDAIAMTLDKADRTRVIEGLIRPAADLVFARDVSARPILGNHQCWHLSAYALAALVTGDVDRLRESMEGLSGCRYQLANGILSDGCWYEGAWGYHFYTMQSLMPYFTALGNLGVKPPANFKTMFDAPFGQMTPDGKLPAMNDSGRMSFEPGSKPELYELAWTWWRDPAHAAWLSCRERRNLQFALYGTPVPEKTQWRGSGSRLYDASGVAVLRKDRHYLALDFGPHGGWHGHCDKLNLLVWADGEMFAEDPGCVGYGIPLHWGWYRRSLAHNTLSVDGDQAAADGRLLGFCGSNDVLYVTADAGEIAKGVRVRRATALCGDLVFDCMTAMSDEEHLYEWTFHSRGTLESSVPGVPVRLARPEIVCKKNDDAARKAFGTDPWSWTTDCCEGPHGGTWQAKWTLASGRVLALAQRSSVPGSLRTATGGAQPPSQSFRVTANRLRARTATFATVMSLKGESDIRIEPFPQDGRLRFSVAVKERRYVHEIADDWSAVAVREEGK